MQLRRGEGAAARVDRGEGLGKGGFGRLRGGLSLHGFWLGNWMRSAPRTEIQEMYQRLGDLVADGSLCAAVEHVYPLEQFKDAIKQSLHSNRRGKILFTFGANDRVRANMDNGFDAEKPGF